MRMGLPSFLLLLLVSISTAVQAQDRGRFGFVAGPSKVAPFPYVQVGDRSVVAFSSSGRGGQRRSRPAAWRHDPDPSCVVGCLPSYWRPVYPKPRRHGPLLPLAAVVERLERISYRPYAATLDGPNYWIEAHDRHQRAVLLIVNAKTGMIRRSLR
jgi:hypothetical protein